MNIIGVNSLRLKCLHIWLYIVQLKYVSSLIKLSYHNLKVKWHNCYLNYLVVMPLFFITNIDKISIKDFSILGYFIQWIAFYVIFLLFICFYAISEWYLLIFVFTLPSIFCLRTETQLMIFIPFYNFSTEMLSLYILIIFKTNFRKVIFRFLDIILNCMMIGTR